ncbi:MAG: precorrin-6Y C5,15-methyltransferase (decarboxylating) subunit CbiT [Desulfofustis sp.]|nr:precorrin-6Y C5,15-methyltransferase (decarboxylating) subunit CbiT [Desulfofustis sp.]
MAKLFIAGCNGTHIADQIRVYLADNRYQLFCSSALLDTVISVFPQFDRQRWEPIVPLADCFTQIENHRDGPGVIVLTSGDPLFYGIGKRLTKRFPDWHIRCFPAVSYMQSCFSHFGINWDDAQFVSLHGRSLNSIDKKLYCSKLFVFTDQENTPNRIAGYLKRRLGDYWESSRKLLVGECIGSDQERFSAGTIDEISAATFRQPNCMIIVDQSETEQDDAIRFGLGEGDIQHSRGLITKSEVRAAVIHRLRLPENGVFWDVGAGSGSISLEASRCVPSLSVYAIEKKEEELFNIRINISRFKCPNVNIIAGEAPEALGGLPAPDCVFIGGSGGRLDEILSFIDRASKETTRIVMTAVLDDTARRAPEILYRNNFSVEISIIRVSRYEYPAREEIEFNPIHLIKAEKRK